MRIFITGIEGFVGRHLAARLAAEGDTVVGSVYRPELAIDGAEEVFQFDVRDRVGVGVAIAGARPDVVVHLAGETSVGKSFNDPATTFDVNAVGAINVLEACREASVGRVLLVTSCEVYGDPDPSHGPIVETAALIPINPYGASKVAQDVLGYQYWRSFGVPVVRARPFPHTGPGQADQYLFPSVARRIALAETGCGPATITVGNIATIRDLLDVRDVVEAYVGLIRSGEPGAVYNVCSGEEHRLAEALSTLCDLAETPVRIEVDSVQRRPADFEWMVGDPTELKATTDWRPHVRWEETMRDLLLDVRTRLEADAPVEVVERDS
ncbi:MAG: GDP-mannose 4,6-dehydratase [Gemmatimonadetes bacterium]|nr:GDP-mannose 4,6-dehydratase [Gemmatimonadota bacterium]